MIADCRLAGGRTRPAGWRARRGGTPSPLVPRLRLAAHCFEALPGSALLRGSAWQRTASRFCLATHCFEAPPPSEDPGGPAMGYRDSTRRSLRAVCDEAEPRHKAEWPGEKRRVKSETPAGQRLTMRNTQNGLEKTKPLGRLDLRRNCRPADAARGRGRALIETTQTAVRQRLATRDRAFFSPNGSGERIANRPGRISINALNIRTCDAKSEGHRP